MQENNYFIYMKGQFKNMHLGELAKQLSISSDVRLSKSEYDGSYEKIWSARLSSPTPPLFGDMEDDDGPHDDEDMEDDDEPAPPTPPHEDLEHDADQDEDHDPAPRGRPRNRGGARQRGALATDWVWAKCRVPFFPKDIPRTARESLKVDMPEDANEYDFLNLYLTDELLSLIVRETNHYAKQFIADNGADLKEFSNVRNWEDTTFDEMKAYLGILVLMGIVYKPRINMYWSTGTLLETPIFAKLMTRDRFLLLTKFLHFSNNDNFNPVDPHRDRLFKIREVCNLFKKQWKAVYNPGINICIDESLVLFKGRLAFKQYIRTKRSRFGIKFYTLSTDSGITLDNIIYCGNLDEELEPVDGYLTTERIPITLCADYLQEGRVLFVDNYYTTVRLAKYLLDRNTHTVGTIRSNRKGFPKELAKEILQKGTSVFYSCEDIKIMIVRYRSDKNKSDGKPKVVHVLSTIHRNQVKDTRKTNRAGEPIKKPSCVMDYNLHMGGVDKIDQQLHQIYALRKNYKWYRKIFLRLFLQSFLNSHRLYNLYSGRATKVDFLGYLLKVITIMMSAAPKLIRNPRVTAQDNVERMTGHKHFHARRLLPENSQRQRANHLVKACRVCVAKGNTNKQGKPIRTQWVCKNCPDEPGLCIEGCFEEYHTKNDYSDQ